MDEGNRHAAFTHAARDPLDRAMTNIARAEYAGKARFD
jgi:hypothetical protein